MLRNKAQTAKRRATIGLLALAVAASSWALDNAPFERIVVFGTSLSDPGNAFALRGDTNTPPDYLVDPFLVPDAPYAKGGHHFTNGTTWIEQFARRLGLAGSVRPAFRGSGGATNYAGGGARAYDDGVSLNLSDQVQQFLEDFGGAAPSNALYVIEMGGNDLRDALVTAVGGGDPVAILLEAVTSIAANITQLHSAGARDFLVWRTPDVGLTPAISSIPGGPDAAGQLTLAFNGGLDGVLAQLSVALSDLQVERLDVYTTINAIVAAPDDFGFSDVTEPCLTPGIPPFSCKSPDTFFFWDGIHPTRAVHAIIAQEAASVLTP